MTVGYSHNQMAPCRFYWIQSWIPTNGLSCCITMMSFYAIEGNKEACQHKTPRQLALMEQCFLQDRHLLHVIWPDKAKVKQATVQQIVPKELRNEILHQFHDVPMGGRRPYLRSS
ncbi:hypothetical protein QOT17_015340 [Balamuthia mandrillaris]